MRAPYAARRIAGEILGDGPGMMGATVPPPTVSFTSLATIFLELQWMLMAASGPAGSSSGIEVEFGPVQQIGSSNYTGVDGHFWMPQPLFRAAASVTSDLLVSVAIHGDGAACPPPERPQQPCDEFFRKSTEGGGWDLMPGGVQPGNSLVRVSENVTRGFGGLWLNHSTNTSGQTFFHEFDSTGRFLRKGDATISGMPPMMGIAYLQSTASAMITVGPEKGTVLTQLYGYLESAPATGGCMPAHVWEKHYCYSIITLASKDRGLNWEFRSAIDWDGAVAKMPAEVEGPCEPSLVVLPDGKTLLSVFRLQSNKNLWMATSTDVGKSFGTAKETNAWAVFPQARVLDNGAIVLTAGRPGIGLWVQDSRTGSIDPVGWRFYNLASEHNKAVGDHSLHFGKPEVLIENASSPTSSPIMTKAYTGLETHGCDGPAGAQSCEVTVSYDRICNGNAGPPGPHGDHDFSFTMAFSVKLTK